MTVVYEEVKLSDIVIDANEILAFDTETCGLYGKIRLAQFYQPSWSHVKLVNWPNPMELTLILNQTKLVMHNAHYDITVIQANTNSRFEPKDYEDTFYLARLHYYNQEGFALDEVMKYTLDFCPYTKQGLDKAILQKSNWNTPVLTEQQKLYAATDVFYLPQVYDAVSNKLEDTSYKLDKLSLHYALDFQNNGMPVLEDVVQQMYKEHLDELEQLAIPINVNSYVKVRPYIGSTLSDGLGLATLALQGNTKAENVRKARRLLKLNSFLTKFESDNGYIYGKFLPSARSGRFTSKDQNLEQIPRKLKKVFGFTEADDKVLIYADYAQLEMRTICAITGEPAMERILREGGDLHNFVATMIFGADFTPVQRQITKTANFNLLYGGGVNMFLSILIKDANLLLTESEGSVIKRKWLNIFTAIVKWQKQAIEAYKHGQAWATPFGRRYTAKLMTDQCNIQNQGFGAEVAKLAMHYAVPKIATELGAKGVRMCNFIHDSYIFESPNHPELYQAASVILAESMQKAWFEALKVGTNLRIRDLPMPVSVHVGTNWATIEKEHIYHYELKGSEFYEAV